MNKYIIMNLKGTEAYTVPPGLEIPKFEKEEDLWQFIWDNDLDSEIDFGSLSNTGLVDIEDENGNSILKNYKTQNGRDFLK